MDSPTSSAQTLDESIRSTISAANSSSMQVDDILTSDDDDLNLAKFHKLAETANVPMAPELMKHIGTLLQLGAPSDEVYHFLGQCINNNGKEPHLPQQKKSDRPKVERSYKPALIELKEEEIADEDGE